MTKKELMSNVTHMANHSLVTIINDQEIYVHRNIVNRMEDCTDYEYKIEKRTSPSGLTTKWFAIKDFIWC